MSDPRARALSLALEVITGLRAQLFIGGEWVDATGGATFEVENPATGRILRRVADASATHGQAALAAAVAAQPDWAATSLRERSQLLWRVFDLIMRDREQLAHIITAEMGKTLSDARGEVDYGAEFIRWFAEEALRIEGGYVETPDGRSRAVIQRRPVGPAVLITPWNFPLAMATRKIGPALAAGCTCLVKPAPQTPLTTLKLAELFAEAGTPAGVVNVVTTTRAAEVIEPILTSGSARKLSFTGSTAVGKLLLGQAARTVMRTSLELGGNAPFIVFADADLGAAVAGAMGAKMRNMGEACTAANRFYVERPVLGAFADRLAAAMSAQQVGDGFEAGVQVGPMIDAAGVGKVERLLADALDRGAKVVCGGGRLDGDGYFFAPTVVSEVAAASALLHEEIFGPVAALVPFDSEDEAVARANATPAGLVAYLFTTDLQRSWRVSEALETGIVGLNTGVVSNPALPFGGVKESGLGREGGRVGIDEFLEYHYVISPK